MRKASRSGSGWRCRFMTCPDAPIEPALHELHFAIHRGFRHTHDLGCFFRRASEEEPELDDLNLLRIDRLQLVQGAVEVKHGLAADLNPGNLFVQRDALGTVASLLGILDRKSTRLNSSHLGISYAV